MNTREEDIEEALKLLYALPKREQESRDKVNAIALNRLKAAHTEQMIWKAWSPQMQQNLIKTQLPAL